MDRLNLDTRSLPPDRAEALRTRFREYLRHPRVREVFQPEAFEGVEVELWRERRFAVVVEDGFVSGAIDRMTITRENGRVRGIEIVDFKSDGVADEAGARVRAESYAPQMRLYRKAVATMFDVPMDEIGAKLVFLHVGVVVPV